MIYIYMCVSLCKEETSEKSDFIPTIEQININSACEVGILSDQKNKYCHHARMSMSIVHREMLYLHGNHNIANYGNICANIYYSIVISYFSKPFSMFVSHYIRQKFHGKINSVPAFPCQIKCATNTSDEMYM